MKQEWNHHKTKPAEITAKSDMQVFQILELSAIEWKISMLNMFKETMGLKNISKFQETLKKKLLPKYEKYKY